MQNYFKGLFDSELQQVIEPKDFLLCLGTALVLGLILAAVYTFNTRYTKSFLVTLALLPTAVCAVIMMVNGNVGTGVAVAGAFSLIRFRSVPGTAKEIVTVFIAMTSGLICGMGYLAFAALFTVILSAALCLLYVTPFGNQGPGMTKTLRVTIPEDLDFCNLFDDIFEKYTSRFILQEVKTAAMGSMYKLTYEITLKDLSTQREFIDELRVRNGNLEIGISEVVTTNEKM